MTGIQLVAAERQRQIDVEKYTAAHDDQYVGGELSWAACAYASVGSATIRGAKADEFPVDMVLEEGIWPGDWDEKFWKPSDDPVRNLVKAGALIVAEIDRINRVQRKPNGSTEGDWLNHCPHCGGDLDTGWECNSCGKDWMFLITKK